MRTIAQYLEAVALHFETDVATIRGAARTRAASRARFAACWILRRCRPDLTLSDIGRQVGRTDHTTIIHALERAESLILSDPAFRVALFAAAGLEDREEPPPPPPPPTDSLVWPWMRGTYANVRTA